MGEEKVDRRQLVRAGPGFRASLEPCVEGEVPPVDLAHLPGESFALHREALLLVLEGKELLLEVAGRRTPGTLGRARLLDPQLEVLDLDLPLPKVVLGLGLSALGGLSRRVRRFPLLHGRLPGLLLRVVLTLEFELLLSSARDLFTGFARCSRRGLDAAGVLLGAFRQGGEPVGERRLLLAERGPLGLVPLDGLRELLGLGDEGFEGLA